MKVYTLNNIEVKGAEEGSIDLRPALEGVYYVVLKSETDQVVKKIIVRR